MKIINYRVSELEKKFIEAWANKNNVEVKCVEEPLTSKSVDLAKGFDGVTSEGMDEVTEDVYESLEKFGVKQLAIRQVGVDNQDLDAAKKHGITSYVPVEKSRSIS